MRFDNLYRYQSVYMCVHHRIVHALINTAGANTDMFDNAMDLLEACNSYYSHIRRHAKYRAEK
jgi:hypothetical protein